VAIPKYDDLMNPTLQALKELGGSGTVQEIEDAVAKLLKLSDEDANAIQRGNRTKLGYRLAWARNYLKRFRLLENSSWGVWALTPRGAQVESVNKIEVKKFVRDIERDTVQDDDAEATGTLETVIRPWEQMLIKQLLKLEPAQFERLAQRLLREAGFMQVEVTGRSGDGGIDGRGVIRIGGLLSFHVIFQCKRYTGSVSAQQIRDFRGAMIGRADKGLFITTGAFTRDARQEAVRDGAPPIDLLDGEQLAQKMKELGLGVKKSVHESVDIDPEWFERFKS